MLHSNFSHILMELACSQQHAACASAETPYCIRPLTVERVAQLVQPSDGKRAYSYVDAIRWCCSIAEGLTYLHGANPVVRGPFGTVLIADAEITALVLLATVQLRIGWLVYILHCY